ncbi:V-type ATP synthase subunit D [Arthrobacter bambusae]|uniref:V-type ATP synthase subunit D n=1 Tax=Arthrobacter bambusae TaxID=1338426 RepID=UPI00277DF8FD|nr:V-type ATP synthase subunit D [Arthrobacter bambusae]MDQ0210431.1 vacuolar-type H+-ATPase subunit D/Vma8 [Arthrobacter bambusae]MDQ0234880.1 vacuolar-type H+-ATPase subunit D/Vma8 [Arthrobacter bambusae]
MNAMGRAAKVRVERRLVTARHGARLLDRKQRILAEELERLQLRADLTRAEWERLAGEAALWLRRSAALDGSGQIAAAAPLESAGVQLRWAITMGVPHPEDAEWRHPAAHPMGGSSALSYTRVLHRSALEAGVRLAAVQRAEMLLTTELAVTRTRQRAVENRWIPELENELLAIRRRLAAQELEEALRLRWAADRSVPNKDGTVRDSGAGNVPWGK